MYVPGDPAMYNILNINERCISSVLEGRILHFSARILISFSLFVKDNCMVLRCRTLQMIFSALFAHWSLTRIAVEQTIFVTVLIFTHIKVLGCVRYTRCNEEFWPGFKIDPGTFFNFANWDQKFWNLYPASFSTVWIFLKTLMTSPEFIPC